MFAGTAKATHTTLAFFKRVNDVERHLYHGHHHQLCQPIKRIERKNLFAAIPIVLTKIFWLVLIAVIGISIFNGAIVGMPAADSIAVSAANLEISNGVIAIAQKSAAKIIVLNSKPSKYWQFKSWDKFVLPKPFGQVDFYMSEPFDVNNLEFEVARDLIKNKMLLNAII